MKGVFFMLDSVKLKALKKQLTRKDEEIAVLIKKNEDLEIKNAELSDRVESETANAKRAADKAADTIREFRDKILEVERLHQNFLRVTEEIKGINEDYKKQFEELVANARKTKEGGMIVR